MTTEKRKRQKKNPKHKEMVSFHNVHVTVYLFLLSFISRALSSSKTWKIRLKSFTLSRLSVSLWMFAYNNFSLSSVRRETKSIFMLYVWVRQLYPSGCCARVCRCLLSSVAKPHTSFVWIGFRATSRAQYTEMNKKKATTPMKTVAWLPHKYTQFYSKLKLKAE